MEIRSVTIAFTKGKCKLINKRESEVTKLLDDLDVKICQINDLQNIDSELKIYEDLKKELQTIYENKGKAAMFRSKCRWLEKGERPTSYFFNLEKTNYNKKTISELELENGAFIYNEKEILSAIEDFYRDLYTSKISGAQSEFDHFTQNLTTPQLLNDERDELEGILTFEECKDTLKSFSNGKSPGEDGFTVEFYRCFFDILGNDLVDSLNTAHEKGQLSISQRRGVIILIPEEEESLANLKNWRPITLLNVDYKVAAKAIAKRIEPLLPKLIHSDQTGFVKGRYIGDNIRLISDLMEQTKRDQTTGILLSLDFRKAFDTLEWSLIQHALRIYNFGTNLRRWVEVFYKDIESAILNNGFATNWIKPSVGVRQGCPLSPFLFILTAELMSNKIRQSDNVKGINLCNHEVKLSQFADDTNLFCADVGSVEEALIILGEFGKISGLRLNIEKTKAMWLGKWANNRNKPLSLKWVHCPTRFLGIYLSYDSKGNDELNFKIKIQKLQTNLDIWRSSDLSLFGRVLIIKALGISSLVYSISNIDVPNDVIDNVKRRLFWFLWKNKRDKIRRAGLYQEYVKGGLRMVDVETMIKSLRLAWIPRLLNCQNQNWKTLPDYCFRKRGGLRFLLNCNYNVKYLLDLPRFYREMLEFFRELRTLYSTRDFHDTILFNNKDILIGGEPFFY